MKAGFCDIGGAGGCKVLTDHANAKEGDVRIEIAHDVTEVTQDVGPKKAAEKHDKHRHEKLDVRERRHVAISDGVEGHECEVDGYKVLLPGGIEGAPLRILQHVHPGILHALALLDAVSEAPDTGDPVCVEGEQAREQQGGDS